jgi:hypothetical protein
MHDAIACIWPADRTGVNLIDYRASDGPLHRHCISDA